jgi:hypothetical protein
MHNTAKSQLAHYDTYLLYKQNTSTQQQTAITNNLSVQDALHFNYSATAHLSVAGCCQQVRLLLLLLLQQKLQHQILTAQCQAAFPGP